ncbi:hypothetical protein Tco_0668297, partial [Tanacetum coccineum]
IRWWSEDIKMHDDKDFELDNGILKIYDELKKMKITYHVNQWWNDYIQPMTKVGSWIDEDMKIDDEPMKLISGGMTKVGSWIDEDMKIDDEPMKVTFG